VTAGQGPLVVLVTAPSEASALEPGRLLVDERLAACANVVPRITSIFLWDGKREEVPERCSCSRRMPSATLRSSTECWSCTGTPSPKCWRSPWKRERPTISGGSKTR
jgi:hypothetical protein